MKKLPFVIGLLFVISFIGIKLSMHPACAKQYNLFITSRDLTFEERYSNCTVEKILVVKNVTDKCVCYGVKTPPFNEARADDFTHPWLTGKIYTTAVF